MRKLANFVAYQAGWFACVIGASHAQSWVGIVIAITIATYHVTRASDPKSELTLVALVTVLGWIWDSVLTATGLVVYPKGSWLPGTAPLWMAALWTVFATTLNVSLSWLKGQTLVAVVLGGIGGPLAFYAGARLGAIELPQLLSALGTLAIGWAVITPLLAALATRFDGFRTLRHA